MNPSSSAHFYKGFMSFLYIFKLKLLNSSPDKILTKIQICEPFHFHRQSWPLVM